MPFGRSQAFRFGLVLDLGRLRYNSSQEHHASGVLRIFRSFHYLIHLGCPVVIKEPPIALQLAGGGPMTSVVAMSDISHLPG